VKYIRLHGLEAQMPPIRIVVVSDTHGFEQSLTFSHGSDQQKSEENPLPEGDILIHCGDFCGARSGGGPRAFDRWLAKQPAASGLKIVVRGNHDVHLHRFEDSGAKYVTEPTTINACGITIGVLPYQHKRKNYYPALECDILVTHVPPQGIRDTCYDGRPGGDYSLNQAVCRCLKKPLLWLCGHIHEAYGYESARFGKPSDKWKTPATLVVNAANANAKCAHRLEHAPVLIEVQPSV